MYQPKQHARIYKCSFRTLQTNYILLGTPLINTDLIRLLLAPTLPHAGQIQTTTLLYIILVTIHMCQAFIIICLMFMYMIKSLNFN